MIVSPVDRVLRAALIVIAAGAGAFGLLRPESILFGGAAWLAFLLAALSGWGFLVVRVARIDDVDAGLRMVWGMAAYLFVAGAAIAVGVCTKPFILALVAIGFAGFAWRELVSERATLATLRSMYERARAEPMLAIAVTAIVLLALINIVGAVAHIDRNPWDDDVAYTPLVKRLLDTGNLIEPFSFRRLAAYGGQTALCALAAARGTFANVNMIDGGLCLAVFLLGLLGYARNLARVPPVWLALVVVTLLLAPDISINTASYWSGAAMFLALYRSVPLDDRAVLQRFVIAGLVGAAIGTLRQNYLPVVVLFVAIFAFARQRATGRRSPWLATIAAAGVLLVPWCIAAWRSNHTFLYPVVQGTWNHHLSLAPTAQTAIDVLGFVVGCALDVQPIVVVPVLFVLVAVTSDTRPGRPLTALFAATVIGFVLLALAFTSSDSYSISRYVFGFGITLAAVFALEVASSIDDVPVKLAPLGRWLLLACFLVQIISIRSTLANRYTVVFHDIQAALVASKAGDPNALVEERRYTAMQRAIPQGARVLAMVDDAAFLDYARNDIANLDTPGWSSPSPQLPSFCGADAWRAYLFELGYRYVAFVRPTASRYMYRREFWVWRIFNDTELFQIMSAYIIDAIDTLDQLAATSKVLYEDDGLVVVDLGSAAPSGHVECIQDEREARYRFTLQLAEHEGFQAGASLLPRPNLVFLDGISNFTFATDDLDEHWYETVLRDPDPKHGRPIRWLYRRSRLRVRGDTDMHLHLSGRIRLNSQYTRPRMDISIGGELIGSAYTDEHGAFAFDADVSHSLVDSWTDLYIVFNTMGAPDRFPGDLSTARLEELTWEPRAR